MDEMSRKDFLDKLQKLDGPKSRNTTIRSVEGKAADGDASQVVDQYAFVDEDMTVRKVNIVATRTCSFGHLLQEARLVARCEVCGRYTCSWKSSTNNDSSFSKGSQCHQICCRCKKSLCNLCVSVFSDGQAYCQKCKWHKHLSIFFDIVKKVVK